MNEIKLKNRILAVMLMLVLIFSMSFSNSYAASAVRVNLKSFNAPTNLNMGSSYSIKGKVKSNKRIQKAIVGIVNSNGGYVYKYKNSSVNSKTFNVKKADTKLKFGTLAPGKYYYRVRVKLKGRKKFRTVLNSPFYVIDNRAESVGLNIAESSGISLSGVRAPGTYNVGKQFNPQGIVNSDSKIKKVEIGIVYAPTNKWMEYKYTSTINSKTFDISKAAGKLKFDKLPGGLYRYRMYAHTENGTKLVFNKEFTVRPSARPQAAVNWAVSIANNDEFSYGKKPQTSKVGCYFCGTNQKRKPEGYEKTYVCLTFVEAAYAHGAGDPEMLAECREGNHTMAANDYNFSKYSCWQKIGYAKDLKVSDLQPGDVLVYYSASGYDNGHVAIYAGGNNMVDAEGIKDCWGPNSIAVRDKAASMLASAARVSSKSYVMRYRY